MGSPDTDSGADDKWFITLRDSGNTLSKLEKNVKICSEQNVNLFGNFSKLVSKLASFFQMYESLQAFFKFQSIFVSS